MTIIVSDIKILKSERMSDAPDGGGRMTSNEVPDGVAGAVFPKVSRLDSVYGRVNLRKVYFAVQSALTEVYGGAHTIITDPPDNPRIGVVLFSTGSHFDDRSAARDRIESYVVAGPLSRARVYGNQTVGQRALLLYQRADEPLPDVGQVLCLSVEAAGYAAFQQYVRIDEVVHEVRTFTDAAGDFERRILSLKLTSSLAQTFPGLEPSRYATDASPAKVRDTQVADSSRYYGIRKLAESIDMGAIALRLNSIYAPLVPSTQRETAISQVSVSGAAVYMQAGDRITYTGSYTISVNVPVYLPRGIFPGSLNVAIFSGFKDKGDGAFTADGGRAGTIDYAAGVFMLTAGGGASGVTVSWIPGLQISAQAHTESELVTLATRGLVYTKSLNPLPGVGSLMVDYRALGKWYRLRDNGAGLLVGNSDAEGSGSVSYTSGAAMVTLGALPDIDSEVIFTWASTVHFTRRANATVDNSARGWQLRIPLANAPVNPGSVTVRWRAYPSDPEKGYTDPTGSGVMSPTNYGSSPGTIDYVGGLIILPYGQADGSAGVFPGTDTTITVEYQQEVPSGATPLVTSESLAVTTPLAFDCGRTGISPKSFRMMCPVDVDLPYSWLVDPVRRINIEVIDNGSGQLIALAGQVGSSWTDRIWWLGGQAVGSINYTTGAVVLTGFEVRWRRYIPDGNVWQSVTSVIPPVVGDFTISSKAAASAYVAKTEVLSVSALGLTYDLTTTTAESVVPGSIYLDFVVDKYIDRNGKLYRAHNSANGSASEAGTIDYATGVAKITAATYGNMGRNSGTPVFSCLTSHGEFTVSEVAFRTAGSPIRPASFYVQATALDGTLCTGSADSNGVVSGAHVRGTIRVLPGVAKVQFGDMVDGEWVLREVFPSTLRYSCVVISNLPLDASILGLDPVRLPSDGRVPVVRPADVCVIHETTSITLPNPAVAGATYVSGRSPRTIENPDPEQADIIVPANTLLELRDATGQRVASDLYTIDLENGEVTMANPLNLSGYTQPLKLRERIEDMALVTDAQITGDVAIAAPTLYAYSANAYLSTALMAGDISARVERLFDQAAWTSVWSDTVNGSGATAQFNDLDYPIEVANDGAVKERWRLNFTSATDYQIIGENLGVLPGTYSTTTDASPVNSRTGKPYFTIRHLGFGAGWIVANQIRFNTAASNYPGWLARTTLGGAALTGDSFDAETRGDTD